MRRMQLPARHIFNATFLVAAMAWSCASEAEAYTPVSLLDGKLTFDLEDGFVANEARITKHVIAAYKARKGDAWGAISRGRRGLPPAELGDYVARKAAEYSKGLSWLHKLTWLKQETVTINGRQWADLRFIGQLENPKGPMDGMLYTRILATSYQGELLEIVFTSNTDRNQATKTKIDRILESVKLDD